MKKIKHSQSAEWSDKLHLLLTVQSQIQAWYRKQSEKIKLQSRVDEYQESEQTRIYHHEIHKKHIRKSSILKLETDSGLIEGHKSCSQFLENLVADLLLKPADLDPTAQELLLNEIEPLVTEKDNAMLGATPDKEEVLKTLKESNLKAAPGKDGISGLLYKVCWDTLGRH